MGGCVDGGQLVGERAVEFGLAQGGGVRGLLGLGLCLGEVLLVKVLLMEEDLDLRLGLLLLLLQLDPLRRGGVRFGLLLLANGLEAGEGDLGRPYGPTGTQNDPDSRGFKYLIENLKGRYQNTTADDSGRKVIIESKMPRLD